MTPREKFRQQASELATIFMQASEALRIAYTIQIASQGTARDKFRFEVAEALTDWRLGCIPVRPNAAAAMIFREAMADIIGLRLRLAYTPLFQTLARIEGQCAALASLRAEPWAPANHEINRRAAREHL